MGKKPDGMFFKKTRFIAGKFKKNYIESDIFRYILHIIMSIILGFLAGAGGIFFHHMLSFMKDLFEGDQIIKIFNLSGYYIVVVPVLGGALTSMMTYLSPALSKERGVLSVIKSIILRKGVIPIKETLFHLAAPIISIGTGAPLGPEGPAAKIGSGIGSSVSRVFRLSRTDVVMYTAAGAGAAISAVFNAPIAGVFFGIEVILLNDLKNRALSALIISSVVADILSRAFLGDAKLFVIPGYSVGDVPTWPYYFILAILCGMIALSYYKMSDLFGRFFNDILDLKNPFARLIPLSFIFGLVLIFFPELYGIGYRTINSVLNSQVTTAFAASLLGLKILFLALFIQAGAYGGTFAPSLGIGAFTGFIFASFMNSYFAAGLDTTAFALVGMGGVLAGMNAIPLTSVLLVFEITNDYKFILPLMFASIISYLVVIYRKKGNIYALALLDENIDVSARSEMDMLSKVPAGSILRTDMDTVNYRMPFDILLEVLIEAKYGDVYVLDDKERFKGVITLKDARKTMMNNDMAALLIADDLTATVPVVKENDPLSVATQKLEQFDIENIPVVSKRASGKFRGIVTYRDILHRYNEMLEEFDSGESLLGGFRRKK